MPQSLSKICLHIVFSTKMRHPYFQDASIRESAHHYLGGTCNNLGCPIVRVGGVADHVHILCLLGRTICVADLVKELKRDSSKWAKTQSSELADFYWQNGYATFSVNPGHVETLREYIDKQEEHHQTVSFQDEYRGLLKDHGLQWEERYVWD